MMITKIKRAIQSPSDFKECLERKSRLAADMVRIQAILSSDTPPDQRRKLKRELADCVEEIHFLKAWLRDREGAGPNRRAILILCDLYSVSQFSLRYAQEHGYELTPKEIELFDEVRRMVEAHNEKRKIEVATA